MQDHDPQDYASMAMEQIPRRSLGYRARGLARRLLRDLLAVRAEPLASVAVRDPVWTTPEFLGLAPGALAARATAEAGPFVRALMRDSTQWGGRIQGSYDPLESAVLYFLVQHTGPRRVFELGPNRGYSTAIIQAAAPAGQLEHRSFDLHDFEEGIRFTVGRHGGLRGWRLFPGPFEEVVRGEDHLDFLAEADLVFIDAAHTGAFGEFYVNELGLLDRVRPGTPIQIHDMYPPEHPRRAANQEAEPVFAWLERHRHEVEVLWCHELRGMAEIRAEVPEWMLYGLGGKVSQNPALWIRKRRPDLV